MYNVLAALATHTPCTTQGYLSHKIRPPPPRTTTLGMVLLYGPRKGLLRVSEVPLYVLRRRWRCWTTRSTLGPGPWALSPEP